jgi:hypothetical protein
VEATVTNYIIDRVGSRPAIEFNGGEAKKLFRWVRDNAGPTVSNDVMRYVRRIYDQAARDQVPGINFNPTAGLRLGDAGGAEQARERVLSDKELISRVRTSYLRASIRWERPEACPSAPRSFHRHRNGRCRCLPSEDSCRWARTDNSEGQRDRTLRSSA